MEASYDWLERGRYLLARGAWVEARDVFVKALGEVVGTLGEGPAAEGLAGAAWELDECEGVAVFHEQAYRCYRRAGDERAAGRMATWLALDAIHFRGEVAVAQGWFGRAHRLLGGLPDGAEHALLALFEGMVALRVDWDTGRAIQCADRVIALGTQLGSPDFEVQGRALRGLALVGQGQVSEGMRLLDEASASALAGELEELGSVWVPCCYMMWGCEQVRDWDRAGEWCQRVQEFCHRADWLGSPFAMCRTHHGAILLWRGEWAAAETELQHAAEDLALQRPWFSIDALALLGELRRRQGRPEEAAELFEQARRLPAARIGLAELQLDDGDAAAAIEVGRRVLDLLAADARLERAGALEVVVRAAAAAGQSDEWTWALDELTEIAGAVGTDAVAGSAYWAKGVCQAAVGNSDAAIGSLERAVECFERAGGPYDSARARLNLAAAFMAAGRQRPAVEEARRAHDALAGMGARHDAERAERLLRATSGGHSQPAAGLTMRQVEVLRLMAAGLTNRAIAERLVVSEHTVKRHVANLLTKLGLPSRAAAVGYASRAGLL